MLARAWAEQKGLGAGLAQEGGRDLEDIGSDPEIYRVPAACRLCKAAEAVAWRQRRGKHPAPHLSDAAGRVCQVSSSGWKELWLL